MSRTSSCQCRSKWRHHRCQIFRSRLSIQYRISLYFILLKFVAVIFHYIYNIKIAVSHPLRSTFAVIEWREGEGPPQRAHLVERYVGLLPTESETPPLFVQESVILVYVDLEFHGIGTSKCKKENHAIGNRGFRYQKTLAIVLAIREREAHRDSMGLSQPR